MIQVVCTNISQLNDSLYRKLYSQASDARKSRADRCRKIADAARCITAGALLQFGVTDHRGIASPCREIPSPTGKPHLEDLPDFYYNISHSGDWVVIAYGNSPVGIDTEQLAPRQTEAIARRYFTPEEQQYLHCAERGTDPVSSFFRIWTGKESYIKYLGTGLATDLAGFSVLKPEELGVFLHHIPLDGACLCLCSEEPLYQLRILHPEELLG